MRLEYSLDEEKRLRLTEISAILESGQVESDMEALALEVERQFLLGRKDGLGYSAAHLTSSHGFNRGIPYIMQGKNDTLLTGCYDPTEDKEKPDMHTGWWYVSIT